MTGYDASPVVAIGYLETSKTLDFELAQTGLTTGPMTVTSIEPAAGSTGGGTPVMILGAGFRSNTTVTFDTASTTGYFVNTTTVYATTPAHAAATVNVRVTSPTGESATLTRGVRIRDAAVLQFQRHLDWLCARPSDPAGRCEQLAWTFRHGDAIHDRKQRVDRIQLRRFYHFLEYAATRCQRRRLLIY